jgi:cyclophilin family peptidyl-prolyl cis-trans isomerase
MTRATIATEKGDIEIELFPEGAPKATANFVKLAGESFFDDVIFHRIVPGFVIQGGDGQYGGSRLNASRVGTGAGYKFDDEPFSGEYSRGTLAMANAGRNTNGSQFFICLKDLAGSLPKQYTIFGQVTRGLDIVDAIAAGRTGPGDRPLEPVAMTSVTTFED